MIAATAWNARAGIASNSDMISVRGTVVDINGIPIPGANIEIKETKHGTMTDLDGNFFLEKVPSNEILVASFVGYKPEERKAAPRVIFVLKEDTKSLE